MKGDEQIAQFPERTIWSRLLKKVVKRQSSATSSYGKPLTISLVGAGNIVRGKYLPLLLNKKHFQLLGVYDVNKEAAERIVKEVGGRVAQSIDDLLRDPSQAVFICTPPAYHAEIALKALASHKNVLCEKPMAANLETARAMAESARRHDGVNVVNFSYRFMPEWLFIRSLVHSGVLGRLYGMWGTFSQGGWYDGNHSPSSERVDAAAWRFAANSGGIVHEMGSHLADLCYWIFGSYEKVSAQTRAFDESNNASEDLCNTTFTWKNGFSAQLQITRVATGYKEHTFLEINGSNGTLKMDHGRILLWTRQVPQWRQLLVPASTGGDFLDAFYRAVTEGVKNPSLATFQDGLVNNEILDAIQRSALSDSTIHLHPLREALDSLSHA